MPYLNYYHLILLAVCGYALVSGRSDERWVAITCLLASLATRLMISPVHGRYSGVEIGVLTVDIATWAAFTYVALRSDRFWPLWVAGLQLTTVVAHALKAVELNLMPQAYAAAGRLWVYPIFLIIVIGTWRGQRRGLAAKRAAQS